MLVITGEYGTGMIRSSLTATPQRHPVLLAKTIVFATVTFLVSLAATFTGFLLGQQAQASTHVQASLATPGADRAIIGAALYLTLIGLLGVGLGFLLRSTAGAIATLFGIVLVAPLLAQALPSPYNLDVTKYLPLSAGTQIITTVNPDPALLAPWAGIGVTALYSIAALAVEPSLSSAGTPNCSAQSRVHAADRRRIRVRSSSAMVPAPQSCMVIRSSWASMSMQWRTPASPAAASP